MLAGRCKGDYKLYSRIRKIITINLGKIELHTPKTRDERIDMREDIRKRMLYNKRAAKMGSQYDD